MSTNTLENTVSKALFSAEIEPYQLAIEQILKLFETEKHHYDSRLADLMQDVLDNKHTTYVPGFLPLEMKARILGFVDYQWRITLPHMRVDAENRMRCDSFMSHLLDILSLIAPMDGAVKDLLEIFLATETDEGYRVWISQRLNTLHIHPVM